MTVMDIEDYALLAFLLGYGSLLLDGCLHRIYREGGLLWSIWIALWMLTILALIGREFKQRKIDKTKKRG